MTSTDTLPAPPTGPGGEAPGGHRPPGYQRWLIVPLRKVWRGLTSMRTALALLFLLALAAVPGALLPQREVNSAKVDEYLAANPRTGPWLDRLQFFEVFNSIWFTSIYLLLFISLIGCLLPRMWEHFVSLRAQPVRAPRNLRRLPRHFEETVDGTPDQVAERITGRLRGWRRITRTVPPSERYPGGGVEISAEKGFLREFGNLVFHFALLALLLSIGLGRMYGYEGSRILVAGSEEGTLCNTSTAGYDSFRAGPMVDGTDLNPFCIHIDDFDARFLDNGQPDDYEATVSHTTDPAQPMSEWATSQVKVNHPLRIGGDRVYVLGNGFAPRFTVTFVRDGQRESRDRYAPFLPFDQQTMLSEGVVRVDPPGGWYPSEDERRTRQLAIRGLFAPDGQLTQSGQQGHDNVLMSVGPTPANPMVAVDVLQGDTGLDTGKPQNVYQIDDFLIDQGRLKKVARVNLAVGESVAVQNGQAGNVDPASVTDGVIVTFDGYERWVSVQVSHDPAQNVVLVSAVVMIGGLLVSMLVRRRRIWVRLVPVSAGGPASVAGAGERRTVVEVAGLARTDQAGWGEGFLEQAAGLVAPESERKAKL